MNESYKQIELRYKIATMMAMRISSKISRPWEAVTAGVTGGVVARPLSSARASCVISSHVKHHRPRGRVTEGVIDARTGISELHGFFTRT